MQVYLQMGISFSRYWANAHSEMKQSGIELSRSEFPLWGEKISAGTVCAVPKGNSILREEKGLGRLRCSLPNIEKGRWMKGDSSILKRGRPGEFGFEWKGRRLLVGCFGKDRVFIDMKRRVVVTGLGAVTPIGNTVDEFWAGIKEGKVGIGPITKFDASEFKVQIAAEVKDFVAKERMDFKAAKRMELFSQYAVAAAKEAFEDAGMDMEKEDPYRVGVIVGSGIGSLQCVETNYEKILTKGPNKVNPLMVPLMISNMAAGNISIQLGLKGKCTNVVTACASGTHCIGDAFRAIQYGDADVMVAGGTEASVCPTGIAGFTALTALSTTNDPEHASRPFDKDRDGFVLGEGSGIVVLEELEHAKARGAKIYAELVGYGATGDAYHITSPAEDGEGAGMAMKLAMKEADVAPEQIDYINAHGTSTHHNDLFETKAIKFALGDAAKDVVVNSTKSMIGHLLGAAGGVEFVVCVKSIEDGFIHQTVGTENVDPECDLNYAVGAPVEKDVNYVLTNSLGFGGHNATLLLKKYEG